MKLDGYQALEMYRLGERDNIPTKMKNKIEYLLNYIETYGEDLYKARINPCSVFTFVRAMMKFCNNHSPEFTRKCMLYVLNYPGWLRKRNKIEEDGHPEYVMDCIMNFKEMKFKSVPDYD
jgi:hypothetical protein